MRRFELTTGIVISVVILLTGSDLVCQASSSEEHVQAELQAMANSFAAMQLSTEAHPPAISVIDASAPQLAAVAFVAAHYPLPSTVPLTLAAVATRQTKMQIGAVPNSSGSTSLVQKPLGATLLNFAIENGAVLEDVNGTNLTLSSSPYAIVAAFAGDSDTTYRQFGGYGRLGFNASFRIADATNPAASITSQQISNAGATLRLTRDYSSRSVAAVAVFDAQLRNLQQSAVNSTSELKAYLANNDPAWKAARDLFISDTTRAIDSALPQEAGKSQVDLASDVEKILAKTFDTDLAVIVNADPTRLDAQVVDFVTALPAYLAAVTRFQEALSTLVKKPAASLIYNYQQPTGSSAYHETGMSYSGSTGGWGSDITANALVTLYGKQNPTTNQHTFRGASGALEINLKIKRSPFVKNSEDQSPVTVAFAGRYQRVQENQHVATKKADIGEAAIKITMPLAGGLAIPLSATFANAGQTIKESFVRGNFGITFDFDKLTALLRR